MLAIVTGAAGGVGAATSARLHGAGYDVAMLDLNGDAVRERATSLDSGHSHVLPVEVDIVDPDACVEALVRIADRFGAVDVLVNAAGAPHAARPAQQLASSDWQRMFGVNVLGIANMAAAAGPHIRDGGVIVNVTSVAGIRARAGLAAYCASKAAAQSLTQTLALELAPRGIRVNAVAPGSLNTPMFSAFLRPDESLDGGVQRYLPEIPLHRLGEPDEVAGAIAWIASPDAAFMTGQTLVLDGGRAL